MLAISSEPVVMDIIAFSCPDSQNLLMKMLQMPLVNGQCSDITTRQSAEGFL